MFKTRFARASGNSLKKITFVILFLYSMSAAHADEIIHETPTSVVVREHPKTGKPYVSIADKGKEGFNPVTANLFKNRPDYRMLDPKIKSGEIPYQGPVSDRKKVYLFAASLAAVGVAGGTAVTLAAASAPAAAGSAGGAGAFGAAGAGVATGTAGIIHAKTSPDPNKPDDFTHTSESKSV